jgi:hypothetical protein
MEARGGAEVQERLEGQREYEAEVFSACPPQAQLQRSGKTTEDLSEASEKDGTRAVALGSGTTFKDTTV